MDIISTYTKNVAKSLSSCSKTKIHLISLLSAQHGLDLVERFSLGFWYQEDDEYNSGDCKAGKDAETRTCPQ